MPFKKKFSQTNSEKSSGFYKLIEFIAKDKCNGRSVDVVPYKWIDYDNETGNLKTVFMPPPYTTETTELLHSLVQNRVEPPKSWPSYEINIVGDAKTYELALDKLKELEVKEYVYSTESGHGEARSLSDKKTYKLKASKIDRDLEKKLLKVPPLHDYEDDSQSSSYSETSKESDSISSAKNTKLRSKVQKCDKTYDYNAKKNDMGDESRILNKPNKCKLKQKKIFNCTTKENSQIDKTEKNPSGLKSEQLQMSKTISDDNAKSSGKYGKTYSRSAIKNGHQHIDSNANIKHIEKNSSIMKDQPCCLFDERKQYTTNDLARLMTSGFRSLCTQITQLTGIMNEIKNLLSLEKNISRQICTDLQFAEKYNIEFPCKTFMNFMEFEENLTNNEVRQDFELNLWKLIDTSTSLLKSLTNILKKYMSRDVAMAFTAVKKVEGKQTLKKTIFSSCIQKVIVEEYSKSNAHPPITDKMYYSTLGSVLNNAKDWEGHRLMRQKKLNPIPTGECEETDYLQHDI